MVVDGGVGFDVGFDYDSCVDFAEEENPVLGLHFHTHSGLDGAFLQDPDQDQGPDYIHSNHRSFCYSWNQDQAAVDAVEVLEVHCRYGSSYFFILIF